MPHLWSGRFDTEPNAAVFDFNASFRFDRRLFEDDCTGSLAWAGALRAAGVLSAADADAIEAALTEILRRGREDPAFVGGPDEDVHSFVERQLVERIGDAGRRLHTGTLAERASIARSATLPPAARQPSCSRGSPQQSARSRIWPSGAARR